VFLSSYFEVLEIYSPLSCNRAHARLFARFLFPVSFQLFGTELVAEIFAKKKLGVLGHWGHLFSPETLPVILPRYVDLVDIYFFAECFSCTGPIHPKMTILDRV